MCTCDMNPLFWMPRSTMAVWCATGMSELTDNIPVSVGAGKAATPNMSRAIGMQMTNVNYYIGTIILSIIISQFLSTRSLPLHACDSTLSLHLLIARSFCFIFATFNHYILIVLYDGS